MQIVIDIDKQSYEDIRFEKEVPDYMQVEIGRAIIKGTVLEENHGRLIDENTIREHLITDECNMGCGYIDEQDLGDIPAVLEAN